MRNALRRTAVLFALVLFASATEWYEDVKFVRNDPFQFDSQRAVLFPTAGLTLAGHPATGKMYAILPASTIQRMKDAPNHLIVIDTHVLTATEAASYKNIFHNASSAGQVPWIVGAIGSIPTAVTSVVGITSTLLDGMMRIAQANQKVSASALEQLMATNGRFELALLLLNDPDLPDHQYVSSTVIYRVTVGGESRSYAISSGTFALKPA